MNGSDTTENPLARRNGLVIQEYDDELLVYDVDSNKANCLNRSAAIVWRSCDGKNSVDEIVRQFESHAGDKVTADFVWLALDQLNDNHLLENELAKRFDGQSRRQVIKKIGLATVVAIPVIASLVAPRNALASSSCACVVPADCITQTGCPSTGNCNGSGVCAP